MNMELWNVTRRQNIREYYQVKYKGKFAGVLYAKDYFENDAEIIERFILGVIQDHEQGNDTGNCRKCIELGIIGDLYSIADMLTKW